MFSNVSAIAKRKPLASEKIKEALDAMDVARRADPKIRGRVSRAMAVLRGDEEAETPANPYGGPSSRESD